MNESRELKNAEQLEELLLLTEEIQEDGTERPAYRGTEDAAQRISDLEREIKQREQSREYSSIKERLEAGRQSIADEKEKLRSANVTIEECQDKI
ncbi:plasmid mobilization system relaxase, partial [human gut metagenome]